MWSIACRTNRCKATPSILSPCRSSIARTLELLRRALNSWSLSSRELPCINISLTLSFQISTKQNILLLCDQVGKPSGRDGVIHLICSTMVLSLARICWRNHDAISPRQSSYAAMMSSICFDWLCSSSTILTLYARTNQCCQYCIYRNRQLATEY